MKKLMIAMTVLALSLSLCACGPRKEDETVATFSPDTETVSIETSVPEQVEITMDNWQQYFTLEEAAEPVTDPEGRLESWDFSYGVFLKPEYEEKYRSGTVDFEIQIDLESRKTLMEESTGAYELGDLIPNDLESSFQQKTFSLEDFRNRENLSEQSRFFGCIADQAYGGSIWEAPDGTLIAEVPANGRLLHAEGSLTFER